MCVCANMLLSCSVVMVCAVQAGRELWHVKLMIKSKTSATGSLCVNTEVQQKSLSSSSFVFIANVHHVSEKCVIFSMCCQVLIRFYTFIL